jgi:hypothetical protein
VEKSRNYAADKFHAPLFRFSPKLSTKVKLNCTDDKVLVDMLWTTKVSF